jgi:hypothetical protein
MLPNVRLLLEYHLIGSNYVGDAAIRKAVENAKIMQQAWIDLQDSKSIQRCCNRNCCLNTTYITLGGLQAQ